MYTQNYSYKPTFLLSADIRDLKAECKRQADMWEHTSRAQKPIKNAPGLYLKNRINAQRWYK